MDGHYLKSGPIGEAINYYLKRRKGLHHFLHDKYAPLDNNTAERRQRCPVIEFSSGIVEGLNNKVKLTMRKSYDFREYKSIEIALYHSLGKLPTDFCEEAF